MTLLKCPECGKYTLKKTCSSCNVQSSSPHPARYSPLDKYGKYRRQLKKQLENKDG